MRVAKFSIWTLVVNDCRPRYRQLSWKLHVSVQDWMFHLCFPEVRDRSRRWFPTAWRYRMLVSNEMNSCSPQSVLYVHRRIQNAPTICDRMLTCRLGAW